MCGRYSFFTDKDIEEINDIIAEIAKRYGDDTFKTDEICPTDTVPILCDDHNIVIPKLAKWGFPNSINKSVTINARSETVDKSPLFAKSFKNKRCIVPSTGFYEWDDKKQKYIFNLPDEPMLYMAALYDNFNGIDRFVIVTTDANESMRKIHDRMPLILTDLTMEDWIYSLESAEFILKQAPPILNAKYI